MKLNERIQQGNADVAAATAAALGGLSADAVPLRRHPTSNVDPHAELKGRIHRVCITKLGSALYTIESTEELATLVRNAVAEELVLDRTQAIRYLVRIDCIGKFHGPLQDHRSAVDSLVDEVHRYPEHLDAVVDRLLDGTDPGESGQERRVDVDHAIWELPQELGAQQLHVAREHDQLGAARGQPLRYRSIAILARLIVLARKALGRDSGRPRPTERGRLSLVGRHGHDRDPIPTLQIVEQSVCAANLVMNLRG